MNPHRPVIGLQKMRQASTDPGHWALWFRGELYYIRLWRGYLFGKWPGHP